MKPARILIADDHEVVRHGVRAILEEQSGWVVCGEATTGREAVAKARELWPDIVVLDISMPELNGLDAARQIRGTLPTKILVLSVHGSEHVVTDVLAAGAHGYVLKSDAGRHLVDAIDALLQGQNYFTERVHAITDLTAAPQPTSVDRGRGKLTGREREVLQLLAEGRSNKEIGVALGITTKTTETHRARILAKLGLHSMSELVRYAVRNLIIEP